MASSHEPGDAFLGRFDESLAGDAIAEEQHVILSIPKSNGMGMRLSTWCSIVEAHEGRLGLIPNSRIRDVFDLFYALKPRHPPPWFGKCNADPFESRRFAVVLRRYVPRLDFFL
jgi:hypothetical protein